LVVRNTANKRRFAPLFTIHYSLFTVLGDFCTFAVDFGSVAPFRAQMKRESGANPEQSRCCKLYLRQSTDTRQGLSVKVDAKVSDDSQTTAPMPFLRKVEGVGR
jgi:hypothetical protein